MSIDPALLSPISALLGTLVGGGASLLGAVYTRRFQDRVQRVAAEIAKRETVYADFVMSASNLLLNAYTRDEIVLTGDEQRMIGLINRMRLFAPTDVVDGAEAVLRAIAEISLKPSSSCGSLRRRRCPRASILIRCWRSVRFAGLTWTTCTERSCKGRHTGWLFPGEEKADVPGHSSRVL